MIPENLQAVEHVFRRSVARRDYRNLAGHLTDLRTMVTEHLATLPAHDPARREITAWGIALTDWGHKMICTQRQKWVNEKKPLALLGLYLQRPVPVTSQVCIDL